MAIININNSLENKNIGVHMCLKFRQSNQLNKFKNCIPTLNLKLLSQSKDCNEQKTTFKGAKHFNRKGRSRPRFNVVFTVITLQ